MKAKESLIVYGTRPEAIKLAPIIWGMQADSRFEPTILVSGQQSDLLEEANQALNLIPDVDLKIMRPDQTLHWIHNRVFSGIAAFLENRRFDFMVVQGDTSTAMAAALAAFLQKIPVVHVEAGLRSHDLEAPYPEEANRRIIGQIASIHLAPTSIAKANLVNEGISEDKIHVTGNTVIDSLQHFLDRAPDKVPPALQSIDFSRKVVVVTTHRRENIGETIESIAAAVANLGREFEKTVDFAVIVHPNPAVKNMLERMLSGISSVKLLSPLAYPEMVYLLKHSKVILTDSGGLQEEASFLGKKLVILRAKTERVEAVISGNATLSGTNASQLTQTIRSAVLDEAAAPTPQSIFGDGQAADRILKILAATKALGPSV